MNRWVAAVAMLLVVPPALAVDGEPGLHDPSTVIEADGKFYVYGTGSGLPQRELPLDTQKPQPISKRCLRHVAFPSI